MNYKTVNKPKSKLIKYVTNTNNNHNKAAKNSASVSEHFIALWKSIFNKKTNSDCNDAVEYDYHDSSYNVTDITELRLIASRKTFL